MPDATAPRDSQSNQVNVARTLLIAAVLSVVAGILLQAVLMLIARSMPQNTLAETAGRVSWSTIVCCALALGTAARKSLPTIMGLMGAVSAPAAFHVARMVQKALSQGGGAAPGVPSPMELSLAKALEYVVFGVLIARVAIGRGIKAHACVGVCVGAAFAVYLLARLTTNAQPPAALQLTVRGLNETMFPVACAVVLWAAQHFAPKADG